MLVNLRLILYVLPTPLISKIPLELIKQVRQYNFSNSDQSNMVYVVAQKSPRKKKLDQVSATGMKSKLTLVPVKPLPGLTDKFPVRFARLFWQRISIFERICRPFIPF